MQDAEEPNLSTEMFGIPDLEQGLGAGAKQKAVDFALSAAPAAPVDEAV
jgi:hypothetical protein